MTELLTKTEVRRKIKETQRMMKVIEDAAREGLDLGGLYLKKGQELSKLKWNLKYKKYVNPRKSENKK